MITGMGDHDRVDWVITMHGMRNIRRTEAEPARLDAIPGRDAAQENAKHIGEQLRVPDGEQPHRDGQRLDPLPVRHRRKHAVNKMRRGVCATRPFLDDGLFRYRKHWGANVGPENAWAEKVLALRVNRLTDAVRRLLQRNPFIVIGRRGLEGIAYWSDAAAEQLKDLQSPGLAALTLLADRDNRPPLRCDERTQILELDPRSAAADLQALARSLS
jgi:hypothetical protein